MIVLLRCPVNSVAGQAVAGCEGCDPAVFDAAHAAILHCGPHGPILIEAKGGNGPLGHSIRGRVRKSDLAILEILYPSILPESSKPQSAAVLIEQDHLDLLCCPGKILDQVSFPKMRKAFVSRKPEVACVVPGNGINLRAGYPIDGHESAVVQPRQSMTCKHPDASSVVLVHGQNHVIRQSICFTEYGRLSFLPPRQTVA